MPSRGAGRHGKREDGGMKLEHVAVAVSELERGLALYRDLLGLEVSGVEDVPEQGVRAALLRAGDVRLELLQPLSSSSPVARFIDRRGEGLHHIAFEVDDLEAVLRRLRDAGTPLVDEHPRPGAGGTRVAFLHPRAAGGVLVELVEKGKASQAPALP